MSSHIDDQHTGLLLEVRRRRAELRASMGQLERALAAPSSAPLAGRWRARLRTALTALRDDFAHHVAITEGPDGLYAELAQHSPRLGYTLDRLTDEHAAISRRLEELLAAADGPDPEAARLRRDGTDLLAALMQHRQRGADLLFEAYQLDIGGET